MPSRAPGLHRVVTLSVFLVFTVFLRNTMSHWNCCVAGCTNSHYTQRSKPDLKCFRIPKKHRDFYNAFFKTDKISWDSACICSSHCSIQRRDCNHLSDIRLVKPEKPKRTHTPYQPAELLNRFIRKQTSKSEKQIVCATETLAAKDTEIEEFENALPSIKHQIKS